MSANLVPSSLLRRSKSREQMPSPDMILSAWKKEREEQRQPQLDNSRRHFISTPRLQSKLATTFNGLSVLTTDEDDDIGTSTNERPIVTTTAAAAESTHISSFDADESISSHSSDSTIITSNHASDVAAAAMERKAPLVTPRIAQQEQHQPQRSSTVDAVGEDSLNRPMNPHSSDIAINHKALQQRDETIQRLTFILGKWQKEHESLSQMQQQHDQLTENIRRCTKSLDSCTKALDDTTYESEQLANEINARKQELLLLQEDINFAKTEKEQLEIEHEEKTLSLEQMSSRLRELNVDLDKVRGERDEAVKEKLQETKVNCDAKNGMEECHVREEELKKQVAQSELLANEISSQTEQLQQDREVLEKERAELSKREDQIVRATRHELNQEGDQLQLVVDSFIFGRSVIFGAQNLIVDSLSSSLDFFFTWDPASLDDSNRDR